MLEGRRPNWCLKKKCNQSEEEVITYADDVMIIAHSKIGLIRGIKRLNTVARQCGWEYNEGNTK